MHSYFSELIKFVEHIETIRNLYGIEFSILIDPHKFGTVYKSREDYINKFFKKNEKDYAQGEECNEKDRLICIKIFLTCQNDSEKESYKFFHKYGSNLEDTSKEIIEEMKESNFIETTLYMEKNNVTIVPKEF